MDALAAQDMTKHTLAGRIGASDSAVTNWTLGRDEPRPATVFAIEEALGLAPGQLSRLLGYLPLVDEDREIDVEAALLADRSISTSFRRALLGLYRESKRLQRSLEG